MSNNRNDQPLAYGSFIPKLEPADTNDRPVALVVHATRRQNMAPEGRPSEYKIVLTFQPVFPVPHGWDGDKQDGAMREYVVNATSYKTLTAKLGSDETRWVGRTIAMEPVTSNFNGQAFRKTHVAMPERWESILASTERARSAAANTTAPTRPRSGAKRQR